MNVSYHKPNERNINHESKINFVCGALYYYYEVAGLMADIKSKEINTEPHDLYQISQASEFDQARFVRSLSSCDTVLANIGPYAHFYHYLREKYNGTFRIIREVQTSSWPAFWLQEYLAGPLTRETDIVTFPSEFCRQYYIQLFPYFLSEKNTVVSYPISITYPEFVTRTGNKHEGLLRLGYLGRISDDKNFNQVLSIFSKLINGRGVKGHLYVAGTIEAESFKSKLGFSDKISKMGIPSECFKYMGSLPHHKIWDFLGSIDVLLFPGLSAFESLGRVLVEASRARVPVVAAHYAAAPELLPQTNLARVQYNAGIEFDANKQVSFGSVDEDDMVNKIMSADLSEDFSRFEQFGPARLTSLLSGEKVTNRQVALSPVVKNFIESVVVTGMEKISYREAMERCKHLFDFFRTYNGNSLLSRAGFFYHSMLNRQLAELSKDLYYLRLKYPDNRMIIGHGSQYCFEAGFFPRIRLHEKSTEAPLSFARAGVRTS